jgi:hypothetical protein
MYKGVKNMEKSKKQKILENIKLFIGGVFDFKDMSSKLVEKNAMDEFDNFLLLCFGDLIGIPLPTTYYTLELLPYLAEDLKGWEYRIMGRKDIYMDRWGDFDN